ncbi:MAG: tetratricopeptide repeat protein [Anaerolineae bacterium]|nr:tetratricopeptide repeat protein [Anaerolineae bacterium]
MSPQTASHRIRRLSASLTALLALAALLVALYALYAAHRDDSGLAPSVDLSDGISEAEALAILERADDATAFTGSLLSFLEVSMAAISIALVLGAWMLRSMILDQVEGSRALSARMEATLGAYEERFAALQGTVENEVAVLSLQLLAEQQVRAHNYDTAIATLQRALTIDETDHATNYLLGYLYTQRKEISLAIAHLERALEKEPEFTPAIAALGLAVRRQGDGLDAPGQEAERQRAWDQAEARLKEALARDPRLTDAEGESYYGSLGGLYRRQGRLYAALDAYERAHQVTPHSSYPLINLASLHKRLGNDAEAERAFRHVVQRAQWQLDDDPRDNWTRCDLAQAYLVLGQPDAAFQHFTRVLDQGAEPGMLETVRSGLAFLSESPTPIPRLEELIARIDAALTRAPQDAAP